MNEDYSQSPPEEGENPKPPEELAEQGVEVPYELVNPETLEELIKAFVLRDGTDFGSREISLEAKIENVLRQLKRKELKLVFDLATETGSIVSVR